MKPSDLAKELAKGRIRPAYLLAGEEPLLRDDALACLRAAVLDGAADDFNLDRLSGRETPVDRLRDAVAALPVMSSRRLVILSEPEAARGAAAKELSGALVEILAELVDQESTVLVVMANKVDKRLAWVKAFRDPAAAVECDPPKGEKGIIAFVRNEAKAQGLEIESGVAELLSERIGPQLLMLRQELTKISLLAGPGEKIRRAHVAESTTHLAEESVWDLMDSIGEGRGADAINQLARMVGSTQPPMVLGALAAHFRKLARLRAGGQIAGPPFIQKKLEGQARRYTAGRLVRCLEAIHETDIALKGAGALPPQLSLERLVIGLAS